MSRIWWATIFGLLLGALLFSMMLRGCDASAELDASRTADDQRLFDQAAAEERRARENLAPVTIDAVTPNLGRYQQQAQRPAQTPAQTVAPATPSRATTAAPERGKTRDEIREETEARRRARELREQRNAERERLLDERRRRIATELAQQSGRITPDEARRAASRARTATTNNAAAAREAFRNQLANSSRDAATDDGQTDPAGASGQNAAGEGDADQGDSNTNDVQDALADLGLDGIPDEARQALEDLGGIPGGGSRPQRGSDTAYTDNAVQTLEDVAPTAHWEPVAQGRAADGRRVASADLYLGFVTQPAVPVVSSEEGVGLSAPGGGFFTGLILPMTTSPISEAVAEPVFDPLISTFATLGGAEPFFTPGSVTQPAQWGETVRAEWATTDFDNYTVIEPDPDRFGDDRYYIWVGRFAAPAGVEAVSGQLTVTWVDLASLSSIQADIAVESCDVCWLEPDAPDPDDPDDGDSEDPEDGDPGDSPGAGDVFTGFTVTPSSLIPGDTATGVITLAEPAPEGGVSVLINISNPDALVAPASRRVPEGQTETSFTLEAAAVDQTQTIEVRIELDGETLTRQVTVTPADQVVAELDRFTIVPSQILGGRTVQATVRLTGPAPESGVSIDVTSSTPVATPANPVVVPAGRSELRFPIATSAVNTDITATITVAYAGDSRSTQLVIRSEVFGDVNRDGVIDGLDLAALLAATTEYNEAADLDRDSDVDFDDLEILVELLEASAGSGQPGPEAPAVFAYWEPLDIAGCPELEGYRSADLFLSYRERPTLVVVASTPARGLSITGGEFYQHPLGNNAPAAPAAFQIAPCLRYDSHLTVGEAAPFFSPSYPQPNPADWGDTLVAEWLPAPGETSDFIQDESRFGDNRYYVRIARITVPVGTRSLNGALETIAIRNGSTMDHDVTIYHCNACWGQYDLSGDGVVSDVDVEIMIDLLGEPHEAADLDGDGTVDLDDLRLLIAAIGT